MKKQWSHLTCGLAVAVALALGGCSSNKDKAGVSEGTEGAYGSGVDMRGASGMLDSDPLLQQRVYYFDFDASTVHTSDMASIEEHARYLCENPEARVRVEGNTDERGSREYNIALGERRAQSVSHILFNHGVARDQVAIVSYGEEKPAVQGHDESAWQYNRRAEIVYEVK